MKNKTHIWHWHLLMVLYMATVAYLCLASFESLPDVGRSFFGIPTDKLVHFAMFFPFPILTSLSIRSKGKTPWLAIWRTLGIFLAGCAIAALTELLQGLTATRTPDAADFEADILALAVSSAITFTTLAICAKRKK